MVQLFDRHHTPIQLTPNGQLYIDKMRLILSDEEHLKEELRLREKMIETVSIEIGYLQMWVDANISIYFVTLVPPNTSDIEIFSSIASIFFTSSGVSKISDAPAFSFKRSSFLVPGIGTRYGFLSTIHAREI